MKKKQPKLKKLNPHLWLIDPLVDDPEFLQKKMFGCEAVYLDGKLVVVLADGDEPWNGLLLPTDKIHHAQLLVDYPQLAPHKILGKWLYLSSANNLFESAATKIIESIRRRKDERFGVLPKPKKTKRRA